MHGERYIMIGDAFAFIDPVFSSGVMLAMNSAFLGADVVDANLRDPAQAPATCSAVRPSTGACERSRAPTTY